MNRAFGIHLYFDRCSSFPEMILRHGTRKYTTFEYRFRWVVDPENVRHLGLYVVDRINYFKSMYSLRAHLQARSVQITCYISRPNMMECRKTGV